MDTTEIEKKSLEAHVELCAERYKYLESKLDVVDEKIQNVEKMVSELKVIMSAMSEKHNDRLIVWGTGIIGALLATVGWLLTQYVFK